MALFVHNLTNVDVSIWDPNHGLTGMSWQIDVHLEGKLGDDGMLLDFGAVKPWIKAVLDSGPDHTLLIPTQAPNTRISSCQEGLCFHAETPYPAEIKGPEEAFTLIPATHIDAAVFAAYGSRLLSQAYPDNVDHVGIKVHQEAIDEAAYGYSHGLKRHSGNCQRIAHGHRSHLAVYQQGQRQPTLEAHWAEWLNHRYLVEEADITHQSANTLTCRYTALQGNFELTLPMNRCAVLGSPTTVENIARWLASQIARYTGQKTEVVAYEGINKGATADAAP
ncbi:6-carboxytetrahydropterin synthase [Halomonas llamarensis]|uniref:6-carboxy-5,6,7,8-tetrahydropterin synthase n=1 Tax=Halomonas llamarensis TaxID=2945104 RepID=A0ABT0SMU8_9GAMM|nr:6-carboxytetrahydropterin synthase [Halomonas llamarensis]MCL7929124.1 6-carboxytetrahydropterin synthase [Halomonas llamarensis]